MAALTVQQAGPKRYDLTAIRLLSSEHLKQSGIETSAFPAWREASDPFEAWSALRKSVSRASRRATPFPVPNPSEPTRPARVASQQAAEVKLLTYLAELDDIGKDPSFVADAKAVERAISPDRAPIDSDIAKALAGLPETARSQLTIAHILKEIDGGSIMLFGFPENPRVLFIATLSSNKLATPIEFTGI